MTNFKLLIIILLIIISRGSPGFDIFINEIEVVCSFQAFCEQYSEKFNDLLGKATTDKQLKKKMGTFLYDKSINEFKYHLIKSTRKAQVGSSQDKNNRHDLIIEITPKVVIKEIQFIFESAQEHEADFSSLKKTFPYKEGGYFNRRRMNDSVDSTKKFLLDRGFGTSTIGLKVLKADEGNVKLEYRITTESITKIKDIEISSDNNVMIPVIISQIMKFKNKRLDRIGLKVAVNKAAGELFKQGFFFSKADIESINKVPDTNNVILRIRIEFGKKYNFSFRGNDLFSHQELSETLRTAIKNSSGETGEAALRKAMIELYEQKGIYNSKIEIYQRSGINKSKIDFKNYYFIIVEGKKIRQKEILFRGNFGIGDEEINQIFLKNASDLAKGGYFDKQYLLKFTNILKNEYMKRGFVFIKISDPKIVLLNKRRVAAVDYIIREGGKCHIKEINISNVHHSLELKMREVITNKEKLPFNPVALDDDLKELEMIARREGYLFARIVDPRSENIIKYNDNFTEVVININIRIEKRTVFEGLVITGNAKTKDKVIGREVRLKQGDIITPRKLEEIKARIQSLNLFSTVKVVPIVLNQEDVRSKDYRVNLLVQVVESDFRFVEFAPGFRTDLGYKLSATFTHLNLFQRNRQFSLKGQANLRQNSSSFDSRRRREDKRRLEYAVRAQYVEPYLHIFSIPYSSQTTVSTSRKRFYSFDADIHKFSSRVSRDVTDIFSVSLKYQFEKISQFDATEDKDHGQFEIGGITPGLALDLRDNSINPKSGAFFGLSVEFANPWFGSKKDEALEINFYKAVLRNKFYIPLSDFVLAVSLSGGVQKNLATGYIPSIKAFRLDGMYNVRGFRGDEINRPYGLPDDITEYVISDRAYFTNLKIEMRYFLEESMVLALFFDFGRLYLNRYWPLELRKSTGLSYKLVTPVGSLDFDYGIKLRRHVDDEGRRESFGRFHLSIGFF